ncbi:hypothetical protein VSVS12_02736 [Vibrio scophthalmi]|uniref:hypothetical protein n=1 Tax=Vibrio scophthalmi TaxID=45658 RepID=UPI00080934A1|nr:hypothetical protein [Vibrio scophthalmi]ANS86485.1 hypothetical protein VSVS12_02736 [Vibrio scophthalmi]
MNIEQAIKDEWTTFQNFVEMLQERNSIVFDGHQQEHVAIFLINKFLTDNIEVILDAQDKILLQAKMEAMNFDNFEDNLKKLSEKIDEIYK